MAAWDGDHDIYTIRADGADLRQQTFNDWGDSGPAWSPNGSRLAYVANAYTEPRLIIAQADGLQGKVVAPELEVSSIEPVWSPTGDKIGFRSMDDLFVVDLETEEAVNLTRAIDYSVSTVRISPGGRLAAFSANVPGQEPSQRLFTVNVDGSGLRDIGFREGDVFDPRWHPVEDKLLFEGWSAGEGARLYVASLDGAVTQLPMVPLYRPPRASWSPDGSMIAYAVHLSGFDSTGERLQLNSLHVATADGGKDLVLLDPPDEPDSGLTIVEAVWAPDSRHIAYSIPSVSGGFGEVDLYVLNICDGASVAVVEEIDGFSTPSWHPLP